MKNRKLNIGENGEKYYSIDRNENEKISELRAKYIDLQKKLDNPSEDINNVVSEMSGIISEFFENIDVKNDKRNIISFSSFGDQRLGSGCDSLVYDLAGNKSYICKEAINGDYNSMIYLKNKYLFLKKYLGEVIPKSYFVFGEGYSKIDLKDFKKFDLDIKNIVFTLQKKVQGKNLKNMTLKEKENQEFLQELEKYHKKYILLKLFLESRVKSLGFTKKTFDVKLDLGYLSNKDSFQPENINFIEKKLNSPNIMWDGKQIYFIDFGSGVWDEKKQKIFDYMMDEKTFSEWKNILKSYNLD